VVSDDVDGGAVLSDTNPQRRDCEYEWVVGRTYRKNLIVGLNAVLLNTDDELTRLRDQGGGYGRLEMSLLDRRSQYVTVDDNLGIVLKVSENAERDIVGTDVHTNGIYRIDPRRMLDDEEYLGVGVMAVVESGDRDACRHVI